MLSPALFSAYLYQTKKKGFTNVFMVMRPQKTTILNLRPAQRNYLNSESIRDLLRDKKRSESMTTQSAAARERDGSVVSPFR